MNETCIFYKEDQVFSDEKSCMTVLEARVHELGLKKIQSNGACMEMVMGKPA